MSERLVELLAPRPGQTIVDLAAGPGDTGFLAAPLLAPGGRLVTTDVAPEMLDAARRRAAELGLEDVEFRSRTPPRSRSPTPRSTASSPGGD